MSSHFIQGSEGTHAVSQQIYSEGKTVIAYTDVSESGEIGESGYDEKA